MRPRKVCISHTMFLDLVTLSVQSLMVSSSARYFSSKPGSSIGCYTGDETPSVTFQPTAQGASGGTDLRRFYENNFGGNAPTSMRLRLLSRTTGADRVVEELYMSFKHSQEMPWILPGVAPTHKQVEVILISIELHYWDPTIPKRRVPFGFGAKG